MHANLLEVPTDIASESSVSDAFDRIDAGLPPVVGLVNLAGIACPTPLHECDLTEFERVMAVNVTGSFLMLRAAAARMMRLGVGRIVNTSSARFAGRTFSKALPTAKAGCRDVSGRRSEPVRTGSRELLSPGRRHRDHGAVSPTTQGVVSAGIPLAGSPSGGDRRDVGVSCSPTAAATQWATFTSMRSTCTTRDRFLEVARLATDRTSTRARRPQ